MLGDGDATNLEEGGQELEEQQPGGAMPASAGAGAAAEAEAEAHLQRAQTHMSSGKHELAVGELSSGLKLCEGRAELECALLLLRAEAFNSISTQIREIPAAQSERRAIYAPDPCHLAGRGLKDAQRALALGGESPKALLHQGQALLLLEKYGEAEEAARKGLALQPGHEQLSALLAKCQDALEGAPGAAAAAAAAAAGEMEEEEEEEGGEGGPAAAAAEAAAGAECGDVCGKRSRQRNLSRTDDAECILCMKLLFEPVTTPCGHTFCRLCFARAMDHSSRCPMCRTVLHVGRELPVTVALKALLERSFPEEYAARRAEEESARGSSSGEEGLEAPIPLFVMSPMLPGERMALNIFEPRYRLMIRRCMEGSHRFGMATVDSQHQLHPVACEVEITECQPLPDGRFYLEIVGRRRFAPLETTEQDGYRVARPRYISDAPVEEGSEEHGKLLAAAAETEALGTLWVSRLKSMAQSRRGVAELLHRVGEKPPNNDLERLSFWIANLACPLMDEGSASKLLFLSTTSTLERLERGKEVLSHLRDVNTPGCLLM